MPVAGIGIVVEIDDRIEPATPMKDSLLETIQVPNMFNYALPQRVTDNDQQSTRQHLPLDHLVARGSGRDDIHSLANLLLDEPHISDERVRQFIELVHLIER